jgi:hypothetical protein
VLSSMWQVAADIADLAVNVVALLTNGELRVLPLSISPGVSPARVFWPGRHQRAQHVAAEGVSMESGAAGGAADEGAGGCRLLSRVRLRTEAGVAARPRRWCSWCAVGGSATTTRW